MAARPLVPVSASAVPALIPLGHHAGKPPIPLFRPVTLIGSRSNARIHLTSSSVSKAHALVVRDGQTTYIRDLASRSKVYINGEEVREHNFADGDLIKIGSFTFKFKAAIRPVDAEDAPPAPAAQLDVSEADFPVPIDGRVMLIGRRSASDVHLLEESVSTGHAVILEMNGQRHVRDLGSRTGTYVNGVAVHQHQLNAGDVIRIGETSLTYSPAELASAEVAPAEESLDLGSVAALDVEDDAPAETVETIETGADDIQIGRSAPPHIDSDQELDLEAIAGEALDLSPASETKPPKSTARSAATVAPASTENEVAPLELSAGAEKLSAQHAPSEADTRTEEVAGESTAANEDADLLPRRGWRPTQHPAADESPAGQSDSESPSAEQDDAVLRLESPTSTEEQFAAPELNMGADQTENVSTFDLDHEEPASDQPLVNIDLSNASPAPMQSIAPAAPSFVAPSFDDELNLSSLSAETGEDSTLDLADEETAPSEPAAPAMRFDEVAPPPVEVAAPKSKPLFDPAAVQPPVEVAAPKSKPLFDPAAVQPPVVEPVAPPAAPPAVPTEESVEAPVAPAEKVTASRTRKKPKQTVGEKDPEKKTPKARGRKAKALEAPVEASVEAGAEVPAEIPVEPPIEVAAAEPEPVAEIAPPVASEEVASEPLAEVIEATEPTLESALDLGTDESSVAPASEEVSVESAAESLSDTALDREMHALSGENGEIVEPQAEAEKKYEWGANQENFLGGYPVQLPEIESADEEFAPEFDHAAPQLAPLNLDAHDEVETDHADTNGAAIDDVNALIDEILAPAGADTATGEDLLADDSLKIEESVDETEEIEESDAGDLLQPEPVNESREPKIRPIAPLHLPPVTPSSSPALSPMQSRPVIPIPPPLRTGRLGSRRRSGALEAVGDASTATSSNTHALRDDERIPPYSGALPATVGRVTTSFDGLAMPPVRETDVFFQMSPPATLAEDDPFGSVAARSSAPGAAPAMTPMDLVEAEETARPRRGTRSQPARDLFFGTAPANKNGGEIHSLTSSPEDEQASETSAPRRAPRPMTPTPSEDSATAANEPTVPAWQSAPETDRELGAHAAARRLRTRTLATLISIWALVWIGAVAGIYFLFPVTSTVEAPVKFSNFDLLTINERHQLQDEQKKLLEDENTRRGAHRILTLKDNEIGPGFLEDTESYLATASLATWPESKRGTMVLQHRGKEDAGDRSRMLAMAQALYEANKPRIDEAAAVQKRFDDLNVNLKTNQQTQQQLAAEIEKLRIQGDSAPDGPAINKIKDDIAKLDKSWGDAVVALKNCQADLAQLKQSASPSTQPANGAGDATASSTSDSQVSQMETQLKDLSTKMSAAQAAKTEQAAEARKALDATLGDFEKQVAATRELMKDSPELASYVAAAQQLQETTRSLIDDLIRRQEQQYSRLNELKTTLTEKMEQRRVELQNADPQLKELNERLETATRQLNAAKSAGMQKEIEDKKSEVDLLAAMVRSRQEQLPKDTLKDYADTIAQLQQIIDVTQKNVEDDRKRTDQLLAQLQTSFTSSQSVEKLPEAQKSAAADLEKRLADINKAREQYNTAISATAVNEDESVKQMRTQIAALQTDIDARKKEVADATQRNLSQQQEKSRQELIDQKESQLSDLTKTEADARLAYTNREKDLRDAQASAQTARESAERLQTLQDQKTKLDAQIAQDTRDVEARKTDADHAVTPIAPSDGEVSVRSDTDRRPWFYLWSSLAIFFGFGTMLMLKMREPTTRLGGFDVIRPMPINGAANSSNGHSNGDSADAANHQDLPAEDREVASI